MVSREGRMYNRLVASARQLETALIPAGVFMTVDDNGRAEKERSNEIKVRASLSYSEGDRRHRR